MKTQSRLAIILFISTLPWATVANAITTNELAAQFEAYKKQQAVELDNNRAENAKLMEQNRALTVELANTQDQVDKNALAVETVGDNVGGSSSSWTDSTSVGGYGELHYTNRDTEDGAHKEEVDFHRFVLFFEHDFRDDLRFFSELELEHAIGGEGKTGEIELEQAYIEYDFNESSSVRAGVSLLPVGILNETHEPNTFYGVERNDVESKIIPSTWWESGVGGTMRFDNGISLDATVSSGLNIDTAGSKAFSIRDGRGKSGRQTANDPIFAARVKYTGMPGLELAGSMLHQTDLGQSDNTDGGKIDSGKPSADVGSGTLFSAHAIYSHAIGPGTFTGKALYAQWLIDVDTDAFKDAENQLGYYFEPSYRMPTSIGDVGVYGRYQFVDYFKGVNREYNIWEAGVNWWPHDNVVVKADYIFKDAEDGFGNESGFDLGIGYQFW